MFKQFLLVAAIGTLVAPALALDASQFQRVVPLNDGTTVYIFEDGKMAMENKYGRVERMDPGHVMEAKNGEKITMQGDEVARLENIRSLDRGG